MQRIPSLSSYGKLAALCLLLFPYAHAGGPGFVAGASYFDPNVKGTPLVWPNNTVTYYTDQGDLSPVLPGPSADALIAEAFVRWTNIPTVALVAVQGGRLAEDVSSANVTIANGVLSLPLVMVTLAPLTSSASRPPWTALSATVGMLVQWTKASAIKASALGPGSTGLRSPWSVK